MRKTACLQLIPIIILLILFIPAHGYADDYYVIYSSTTAGGTISYPGEHKWAAGSTPLYTIQAGEQYKIESVLVDQKSIGPVPAYTFPPVHANHTIFASFRLLSGSITVTTNPRGAAISIDGVYKGTTWMGGTATFSDIPVGKHILTVSNEGYQDWISEVEVSDGEDTHVYATLVPAPTPTTSPTTTVQTTTPTTSPTTTVQTTTPTTSPTTTQTTTPTTSPTTTVQTTTPTTSPTTTVQTTTPTTSPTTTVQTTTPTTSPTTTQTTTPTTSPTTTVQTTTPTATATANQTAVFIVPPFISVYTQSPSPTQPGSWNMTAGMLDFRGRSGAVAGLILSIILCAILVSSDLIRGKNFDYNPSIRNRVLGITAYLLSATGLFMSLTYIAGTAGVNLIDVDRGLWIVMSLLTLYLCISSLVLIIATCRAWPLRWMIKVHTASGVFLAFIGVLVFLSLGSLQGAPLAMGISAALLAAVSSRWQDIQIMRQTRAENMYDTGMGSRQNGDTGITRMNTDRPPDSFPGEIADGYYDIEFIGSGGISRVFLAKKRENGETVALKIPIHFDETAGKSFMKEIMAWEGLNHPNIVRVSEVNILPVPYVEMEYVDKTLNALPRPMASRKAAEVVLGIAKGLEYAHGKGIIHRDIKPHNILLTATGTPKITDWGMSKVIGASLAPTLTGFSLSYAAPEQVSPDIYGDTDQRTDIYQLGTLFFELVTGTVPFEGDEIGRVSSRIASEAPPLASDINPNAWEVETIIQKCIEKDPAMRYQSVTDLVADLENYLKRKRNNDKYQIFEE